MPNHWVEIDRPDILIVEGLNVLQAGRAAASDGKAIPFVSDFFDFSIYLDADEDVLQRLVCRPLPDAARHRVPDPKSYFHRYAKLTDEEAVATATAIWTRINLVNLHENILPTRPRADLILTKGDNHRVEDVALRSCNRHSEARATGPREARPDDGFARVPGIQPQTLRLRLDSGSPLRGVRNNGNDASRRVAVGAGAEMVDVARVDRRDRQHDQHVGGAELAVDHRAVADRWRRPADSP